MWGGVLHMWHNVPCLHSVHILQWIGSCMSLVTTTLELVIKMHLRRRRLAVEGKEQITLTFMVF